MKQFKIISLAALVAFSASCTKLEEKINGEVPFEDFAKNADIPGLLKGCYTAFRGPFQDQTGVFCLQDMSTDQCLGPTRGGGRSYGPMSRSPSPCRGCTAYNVAKSPPGRGLLRRLGRVQHMRRTRRPHHRLPLPHHQCYEVRHLVADATPTTWRSPRLSGDFVTL